MDDYLLDKPAERKKSKKQKENIEVTEEFGGKLERKKSKKNKDKEVEDGEEEGETGDGERKKKKRKKGSRSTATSCATSRAPSPAPSMEPTELDYTSDPQKRGGSYEPLSDEIPYKMLTHDRFKQITKDVNHVETAIQYLYEKEKLYKLRMMNQKYWHKPDKLHFMNLVIQEKNYKDKIDNLDRNKETLIPEREPDIPKPIAFVSDYGKCAEDNINLAIAASMTKLASRLEETRYEREREYKLICMNNKLMDSIQSLGKCVENLVADRAPVRANQYNAMPSNVAFYQEQLARMDADNRNFKNKYLEQEPLYTPGNISYHKHPFENITENNYKSITNDNYEPCYKVTKKRFITDQDVATKLSEIKASKMRNRARTEEEFEEQEKANDFVDKFDPNWKFDTSVLEDKDKKNIIQTVPSNYMRVRFAQLRARQRNAVHEHYILV